jgi:hypothetical protein
LIQSPLIDQRNYLAVPDFVEQVQLYYENIVLSLFSYPQFLVVTWADNPDMSSGIDPGTQHLWPCTKSRYAEKFIYRQRDLWIVYGISIFATIVSILFGAIALSQNNHHARDTKFSNIVAATRAPCLEELPWKRSKWGEVPMEIRKANLGYGLIRDDPANLSQSPLFRGIGTTVEPIVYYGFAQKGKLASERPTMGMTSRKQTLLSFKSW